MKQTKSLLSDEQLRSALFSFQDLMERLTCPFFPLRNTALEVYNESTLTGEINVGVLNSEWTEQRQAIFDLLIDNMHIPCEETPKGYELSFKEVPVHMTIIKRNYQFFKRPEIRFFGVNEFLLPNPLDKYLKAQYLIK